MNNQKERRELDEIYISIGNGAECTDELLNRIKTLTEIIDLPITLQQWEEEAKIEPSCSDPYCNGWQCWECAAIRGGDPMDV